MLTNAPPSLRLLAPNWFSTVHKSTTCSACYSTSSATQHVFSPPGRSGNTSSKQERRPLSQAPITEVFRVSCRQATTSSVPDPHAASAPTTTSAMPSTSSGTTPASTLTWNAFLRLRRLRRRYNTVASIGTAATTTGGGIALLTDQAPGSLGAQVASLGDVSGIDPIMALGLTTVAAGVVGWMIGPIFGGAVFRLVNRDVLGEMAVKERQFYQRIRAHRVDPTSSSMSNPVPDYYGEKIGSVGDYRRWLKDQRAFNKRRQSFV